MQEQDHTPPRGDHEEYEDFYGFCTAHYADLPDVGIPTLRLGGGMSVVQAVYSEKGKEAGISFTKIPKVSLLLVTMYHMTTN